MPVDATVTTPTPQAPYMPKFKFPQAEALGKAMLGNLCDGKADPDALLAVKDSRDIARAEPAQANDKFYDGFAANAEKAIGTPPAA